LGPENRGFPRHFVACILIFLENVFEGQFTVMMYSFDFGAGGRLDIGPKTVMAASRLVRSDGRIPVSSTSSIAKTFFVKCERLIQLPSNFM
jgi:hypothetical protein